MSKERRIAVYSMARSGHHAVMHWVQSNAQYSVKFDNRENGIIHQRPVAEDRDYYIFVIRDSMNWLASFLKSNRDSRVDEMIALHKEHCSELRSRTSELPLVTVIYNRWVSDKGYRDEVAGLLGFTNSDEGMERVAPEGCGSSFDGMSYDGSASRMGVNRRWVWLMEDENFLSKLDEEMRANARELFGVG